LDNGVYYSSDLLNSYQLKAPGPKKIKKTEETKKKSETEESAPQDEK
jgi:hypothetical protein